MKDACAIKWHKWRYCIHGKHQRQDNHLSDLRRYDQSGGKNGQGYRLAVTGSDGGIVPEG